MPSTYKNHILVPLTTEFVEYWSNTEIKRLIENNYLKLFVDQKDYKLVTKGKGLTTKVASRSGYGEKDYKKIGFRVNVRNQLEALYIAMLEIANNSAGEGCALNPIEIIDYCYCHNREDRERGYRIRRGVFEGEFSQVGGTVTQGYFDCDRNAVNNGNRYGAGFSFKFMEIDPLPGVF